MHCPNIKKFFYPLIGTLTVFQITLQQTMGINSPFIQQLSESSKYSKQSFQTLLLQNGIFIFGCFIGTEITKMLQNKSNKFIFLLSDLIYFFSTYNCLILHYIYQQSRDCFECQEISLQFKYYISGYFVSRIVVGIAVGINYTQAIIYIKQMTSRVEGDFFFRFIPFQLQLGLLIGAMFFWYEFSYKISIILILQSVTVLRMILLLIFEIETPQYYFLIQKDIRRSKQVFQKIHNDNIQTYWTIFDQYEKHQKLVESGGVELLSNTYIKKYYKCIILLIIGQLSGFNLIFIYFLSFQYEKNTLLLEISFWIGLLMILLQLTFYRYIRKSLFIQIGQLLICIGLALFSFQSSMLAWAFSLTIIQIGQYTGLGSQIICIVLASLPEIGILYCITAQWITDLGQMCLLGLFFNKTSGPEEYEEKYVEITKIYFYISCFNQILLFILFHVSTSIFLEFKKVTNYFKGRTYAKKVMNQYIIDIRNCSNDKNILRVLYKLFRQQLQFINQQLNQQTNYFIANEFIHP